MKHALIVIAAHKAEKFLPACLASIAHQIIPEGWQVRCVVVSDHCERTTWHLQHTWDAHPLRPQSSDYVRFDFFKTSENVGPYLIRNSVIEESDDFCYPDAIVIFDADDIMHPLYLASVLPLVDKHKGLVGTARTHFIEGTGRIVGSFGFTNGVCSFHRDVWALLGGFRSWRIAADHDFIRRAETAGVQMVFDRGPMFARRIHPQSLTNIPETMMGGPERTRLKAMTERLLEEGKFYVAPETVELTRIPYDG